MNKCKWIWKRKSFDGNLASYNSTECGNICRIITGRDSKAMPNWCPYCGKEIEGELK